MRECQEGDVYWLDSCGARGDKAEECGARLCQLDACEPTDELACAGLPLEGVCHGNVVRGCLSGWPFERDCTALGKRCVVGEEGAVCRKPSESDCEQHGALPRCEDQKLLSCMGGQRVVRDCSAMGARCEVLQHTGLASCVIATELERAPRDTDPCGPCGCPDGLPQFDDEACNGRDDDGDTGRRASELRAARGRRLFDHRQRRQSSHSREDIEQEIARVDTLFSADHGGLPMRVELARHRVAQPTTEPR